MNSSSAILPVNIATEFPGHTPKGDNLVIINATNNTEYICVAVEGGGATTNSEPVVLYIAGMLYYYHLIYYTFLYNA